MDLWDSGLKFDEWVFLYFLIGFSDGVVCYLKLDTRWSIVISEVGKEFCDEVKR
jgi:hypothetical protein